MGYSEWFVLNNINVFFFVYRFILFNSLMGLVSYKFLGIMILLFFLVLICWIVLLIVFVFKVILFGLVLKFMMFIE